MRGLYAEMATRCALISSVGPTRPKARRASVRTNTLTRMGECIAVDVHEVWLRPDWSTMGEL